MSKIVKLFFEHPNDATFLHCRMCLKEEKKEDISAYIAIENGHPYIAIYCNTHKKLVTSHWLKEVEDE